MKHHLENQAMPMTKQTSNQAMLKLFAKGKNYFKKKRISFLLVCVCLGMLVLFEYTCMSFYSDEDEEEEHRGVENLVSVVQDLLIAKTDDDE